MPAGFCSKAEHIRSYESALLTKLSLTNAAYYSCTWHDSRSFEEITAIWKPDNNEFEIHIWAFVCALFMSNITH